MADEPQNTTIANATTFPWRMTKLLCWGVVFVSILSCVLIAVVRSKGLTQITVTSLNPDAEPRDHGIPLIKQHDALPDYELILRLNDRRTMSLGTKPNTSAKDGLTWTLNDPVSVAEIAGVRLQDQDKVVSDVIAEVQVTSESVSAKDYRFDFTANHSATVGVRSFFLTPIGIAISGAFFIAVLLIFASAISV